MELLCSLARRYGWQVRVESSADYGWSSDTPRLVALEVRYTVSSPLNVAGATVEFAGGETAQVESADISASVDRVARRPLGPGDDRLDKAAWELLDALRLLGVLILRSSQ
jgi:hypothetical protein